MDLLLAALSTQLTTEGPTSVRTTLEGGAGAALSVGGGMRVELSSGGSRASEVAGTSMSYPTAMVMIDGPDPSNGRQRPPAASHSKEGAIASLISPIVSVLALSSAQPDGESTPAPPDGGGGAGMSVVLPIDIASAPPPTGGGRCTPLHSRRDSPAAGPNGTCVAGCCEDGLCACRRGYSGVMCEDEVRCVLMPAGTDRFHADGTLCATETLGTSAVLCTCTRLGVLAAMRFRLTPATNLAGLSFTHPPAAHTLLLDGMVGVWPLLALVTILLALSIASVLDAHTLYIHPRHPRMPEWLTPHAFSLRMELLHTVFTRTAVLRIAHTYPGHTLYTRAQLTAVLATSLLASALSTTLYAGVDAESCAGIGGLLTLIALTAGSLVATVGRLSFRAANLRDEHTRRLYYTHKSARVDAAFGASSFDSDATLKAADGGGDGGGGARTGGTAGFKRASSVGGGKRASSIEYVSKMELGGDERRLVVSDASDERVGDGSKGGKDGKGGDTGPAPEPPPGVQNVLLLKRRGLPGGVHRQATGKVQHNVRHLHSLEHSRPRVRTLVVQRWQLATSSEDDLVLGVLLTSSQPKAADDDDNAAHFVPALAIEVIGLFHPRYRVALDASAIPPWSSLSLRVVRPPEGHAVERELHACSSACMFAWGVNSLLLVLMLWWLLLTLEARRTLPAALEVTALSDSEWAALAARLALLGVLNSLLLVDAMKVLCLTLTSRPVLQRAAGLLGAHAEAWMNSDTLFARTVRKVLRRVHKVFDVLM